MNSNVTDIVNSLRHDDSVEVLYIPAPYQDAAQEMGSIPSKMWRSIWVSEKSLPEFEKLIGKAFVRLS